MYSLKEIENGAGFFADGSHTLIYQHDDEDVFVTDGRNSVPAPGWHLAGGGRLLADGEPSIDWCDAR